MELPSQVTFYEEKMLTTSKDVADQHPNEYRYIGDYANDDYAFYVERTYLDRTATTADYSKGEKVVDANAKPVPAVQTADTAAGQKVVNAKGVAIAGATSADLVAGQRVVDADGNVVPFTMDIDAAAGQKVQKFQRLTPKMLLAQGWTMKIDLPARLRRRRLRPHRCRLRARRRQRRQHQRPLRQGRRGRPRGYRGVPRPGGRHQVEHPGRP